MKISVYLVAGMNYCGLIKYIEAFHLPCTDSGKVRTGGSDVALVLGAVTVQQRKRCQCLHVPICLAGTRPLLHAADCVKQGHARLKIK